MNSICMNTRENPLKAAYGRFVIAEIPRSLLAEGGNRGFRKSPIHHSIFQKLHSSVCLCLNFATVQKTRRTPHKTFEHAHCSLSLSLFFLQRAPLHGPPWIHPSNKGGASG